MPAEHDLDPPAMTETERVQKRRYHAYFAFEQMHPMISRDQFGQQAVDPLAAMD